MPEWFIDHFTEYLAAYMFLTLAFALFTGLPVAVGIGGTAMIFGLLGVVLDVVTINEFFNVPNRMWGGDGASGAIQNPVLVAIPCFIFMGTMFERSGVAKDLLHILQVMLKRIPGGLALSVTVMGTIMAATTGIIGASVVMMTLLALPTMLQRQYNMPLATGTLAASATLGILIPPSIMLVLMANLMSISVGNLFLGAVAPGLVLSGLYFAYILIVSSLKPELAPPLPDDAIQLTRTNRRTMTVYSSVVAGVAAGAWVLQSTAVGKFANWGLIAFFLVFLASMHFGKRDESSIFGMILRGFIPPVFLIVLVLGSIFGGWATPTEAAGIGAFGSMVLALANGTLNWKVLRDVCHRTALTTSMIFFIFLAATAFAYFFRALYGEDLIIDFIKFLDLTPWSLLILLAAVVFLLGFFFDWLEITLIILPVFTPVVREMAPAFASHLGLAADVPVKEVQLQVLYWFALLVAINLQTSFLTPPFGFALFYMKGVAPPEVKMQSIYRGIIPFVILQVIGLAIVFIFPEIALWLPNQVLK
jgi:TRAP-type mannitol/chloroaromatic compound transport system permease large subunit